MTDFESLKSMLYSDIWPLAVDPDQIVDISSEEQKIQRAREIFRTLPKTGPGTKVLDFGCGEGHLTKIFAENGFKAVGFDSGKDGVLPWETAGGKFLLTQNWDEVAKNGPYDLAVAFDVLDHLVNETPVGAMNRCREVMRDGATVSVRFHPWCSRHGSHLYRQVNKAYVHLVFTEDEMREMGWVSNSTARVIRPLIAYNEIFHQSGFSVLSNPQERSNIEPFFRDSHLVRSRIEQTFAGQVSGFPEFQMGMAFLDYVGKKG